MDRTEQEKAFQDIIVTRQIPSARDNWWQGDCMLCDGYTTGAESVVQDWGYEHVLTCPAIGWKPGTAIVEQMTDDQLRRLIDYVHPDDDTEYVQDWIRVIATELLKVRTELHRGSQSYTPLQLDNQPFPCLAGGGISCGIWVYCDKPRYHSGLHTGWSTECDGTATRTEWEDDD